MTPLTGPEARAILAADEALDHTFKEREASGQTLGSAEGDAWRRLVERAAATVRIAGMTITEAQAILFVGTALHELFTSLRNEQIEALNKSLDTTQKILCLEIVGTISPPRNSAYGYTPSAKKRETWAGLIQAALDRIAAGPEVS